MNSDKYIKKPKEVLEKVLTKIQYEVTQNNATERPFQNEYFDEFRKGIYVDITTGDPLVINLSPAADGLAFQSQLMKL